MDANVASSVLDYQVVNVGRAQIKFRIGPEGPREVHGFNLELKTRRGGVAFLERMGSCAGEVVRLFGLVGS